MVPHAKRRILAAAVAASTLAVPGIVFAPRRAHAEPPNAKATPVYVLSIETDDADDQADALTQALRSRVRQAQGWSLAETTQSFGTLAIALKCPPKPDAGCLQRIGDQLHADRFVWGTMAKKKGGQVLVDLHLWVRGKSGPSASEAYSDNLKDASDESLRAIAARLFGGLSGSGSAGTVVVHAGDGKGTVVVDGVDKAELAGGLARIDLPGGQHSIGVRIAGFASQTQNATVTVGAQQDLSFDLTPTPGGAADTGGHFSFPARKVLAWSAIVGGVLFVGAGGYLGYSWLQDRDQLAEDRKHYSGSDPCVAKVNSYAADACNLGNDAPLHGYLGAVFDVVGVGLAITGIVLVTGTSSEAPHEGTASASKQRVDVLPAVGPRAGSLAVRVTY